jgi:phage antirepressor YoqD-like protein
VKGGLLTVRSNTKKGTTTKTVMVTPKGQEFFVSMFLANGTAGVDTNIKKDAPPSG